MNLTLFACTRRHPVGCAIIAIGLIGVLIVHTIPRRLLMIVDTARSGDPFVVTNTGRL